ncbi:hypothetical protein NDU88_000458 [Pleurodeles waltl]|uniref:Uncharacterized protein n=1 Tax=Pleurodeles waltl TaxID=8319 RepID=A0AAV7MJS2_PLEWA|nr:hypothetical protein NDU88_000458 [Pleurodeles waltl]
MSVRGVYQVTPTGTTPLRVVWLPGDHCWVATMAGEGEQDGYQVTSTTVSLWEGVQVLKIDLRWGYITWRRASGFPWDPCKGGGDKAMYPLGATKLRGVFTTPLEVTTTPLKATTMPLEATATPFEATTTTPKATETQLEATPTPLETTALPLEATAAPLEATAAPLEATATPLEPSLEATTTPMETTALPLDATPTSLKATTPPREATTTPLVLQKHHWRL